MPRPRGPRGEKVTVVCWTDANGTVHVEAYAAAGVRETAHKSALDRLKELDETDNPTVHTVTVK